MQTEQKKENMESIPLSSEDNQTLTPIKEGYVPVYERVKGGCDMHVGWMTLEEFNMTEEELQAREENIKDDVEDCFGGTCTVTPLGRRIWNFLTPCVRIC